MKTIQTGHLGRLDLGLIKYKSAWEIQKKLVNLRLQNKIPDTLITAEHLPVITMGRGSSKQNLLVSASELERRHIDFFEIERGGDITFHGPGQAILYPIIDIGVRGRDLHRYLRDLEQLIIAVLREFGLSATLKDGLTGVWVNDHKVAAIGVAVSHWITYHGLALNVTTDLSYFDLINPCGITQFPVGSLSQILKQFVEVRRVHDRLVAHFMAHFDYATLEIVDQKAILNSLLPTETENSGSGRAPESDIEKE